jgi:hypothetical protein
MKELKKQLEVIVPYEVRYIERDEEDEDTAGYCLPWEDSIIRILPNGIDHDEVIILHEWFHLYQYKVDNHAFDDEGPASCMAPVGSYPHDANSIVEEEADAFALLLAKKSLEYDLENLETRIWLSYMWRHIRRTYPELKKLLNAHYFTVSSGFQSF